MKGRKEWRCFFCDEVFKTVEAAAAHFGPSLDCEPACTFDAAKIREMEAEIDRYREEDGPLHRQLAQLRSAHQTELRREEEKGYARGLADARAATACPFCLDAGFDLVGLKAHLERGDCHAWNEVAAPAPRLFSGAAG